MFLFAKLGRTALKIAPLTPKRQMFAFSSLKETLKSIKVQKKRPNAEVVSLLSDGNYPNNDRVGTTVKIIPLLIFS